jgi:hypothetical protein
MDLAARIRHRVRAPYAWTFFFLTTFMVFSSFFLEGKVLLSSTDNTFNHYPNLLFGHRMLRQGDFGLWNPLIFAGVDFSSSFHHHMLHPLNWPLLLLPERFVLHGVTVQCYLEISLLGLLAFRIIRRVQDDDLVALFIAIVAQLGGFTWFTTTTLIGTHLLFAAAASIYVIVSHADRRPVLNYLYLALCFFDILMMGHVAYISAFGLPVVAVFFWWTWPQSVLRPWRGLMPAAALAFVTAFCMSAVRLWPIMQGLMYEQSALGELVVNTGHKDVGYLALTGFIPELFGLNLGDAGIYTSALTITDRHTQFHNFLYYGIVPILLIWFAVLRGLGPRSFGLAAMFLVVALTPMNVLQPLTDIVNIVLFPMHHPIIGRTGGMFLLCAALVPILRSLQETGIEPEDWRLRWFLALVGIVLVTCLAMIVRVAEGKPEMVAGAVRLTLVAAKVLILAGLPACFIAVGRLKLTATTTARLTHVAAVLFGLTVLVVAAVALRRGYFWHTWITFRGFAYTVACGLWAVFSIWSVRRELLERPLVRWRHWLFIGSGIAALLLCLVPIHEYFGPREAEVLLISGALSIAKFVLLACVALEIVVLCGIMPGGRRQLLPLLGLLTFGELLGQTKLYEHVGTHPFVDVADLYPRRHHWDEAQPDWLASANCPDLLTNSPLRFAGAAVPGWTAGGSQVMMHATSSGARIAAGEQDGGTLFQDVTLPCSEEALTMGAWVRSSSAGPLKLMLNTCDQRRRRHWGTESRPYSGQGAWQWLTATVAHGQIHHARPHVAISGRGEFEVCGLSLVKGVASRAAPRPVGDVHVTEQLVRAEEGHPAFDVKSYRANKPTQVLRWQDSELMSNINMPYDVASYTGVDSDVKKGIVELIKAFDGHPPGWLHRGGILGKLTNPRLLDILGAKYDWDGYDLVVRPNALARLSLFQHFEVQTDHKAMLARLTQPDFDPAQSVVLNAEPGQAPGNARRFQAVGFESPDTSRVTAQLNLNHPGVLLFNDSYSKYWECTCNGQPVPVMTANGNFMAAALPAGLCHVVWEFRPVPVLRLFWLSVGTSTVLAGVAIGALFSRTKRIAAGVSLPSLRQAA